MSIVVAKQLKKTYVAGDITVEAIRGVDFTIEPASFVSFVGPSGSGKSTLLNRILQEEKAIVSDIPGTTRDAIEDTILIDGFAFRVIATAGLSDSPDKIENNGIEKT